MDLGAYYRKIRAIEAEIKESSVVIVSRDVADGGRPGVPMEVPRAVAARSIAEGNADLASTEQAQRFRSEVEAKWKEAHGTAPRA